MKLFEDVVFMDRVMCLIKRKATGDVSSFGQKLGMSDRNVIRLISKMRDVGFPIKYCTKECTYYLEQDVKYDIRITVGDQDLLKIRGGRKPCLDLIGFQNL